MRMCMSINWEMCIRDREKGDDSHLRWSLRSKDKSGFVFINNYERLQQLSAKKNVQFLSLIHI